MKKLTSGFWVTLSTLIAPPAQKDDKGATIIEYAAILLLVAAAATLIWGLGIPEDISGSIGTAISDILSGPQ
ncbi:hypothetical protein [Nocardiopsis lambiniae]|uniref:Flp family type IVb pilin n=1 Tax=Nocardiopsis lambiniae TaxID=3075539 RepID=A0ABU2M4M5_9ACTN|nr:hypothetical protein [Nocardiopsis sp. DSM 44743]MDT0327589.1 hypothetical protein [Nocardiopsis sp. DSM 44743]